MAEEQKGQTVQDPPGVTSEASVSEPYFTKSTAQVDLEQRLSNDNASPLARIEGSGNTNEVNAPYAVEGNDTSGYVGVSPEYMTYANDTEKPLTADEGVEADLLE